MMIPRTRVKVKRDHMWLGYFIEFRLNSAVSQNIVGIKKNFKPFFYRLTKDVILQHRLNSLN